MVPKGRCHLCGEEKGLTYEHVPARSTFNQEPVEMFGLESWLSRAPDGEMSGGELKERGAGAYTLCYRCNTEITGDHYVAELKRWTAAGMRVAQELARGAVGNAVDLKLSRAYPARLIKQIVAMLASVNSGDLNRATWPLRGVVIGFDVASAPRALRTSRSSTMLYRSNTDRVLCPVTAIAIFSATPARIRFRAAVRRKSCSVFSSVRNNTAESFRPGSAALEVVAPPKEEDLPLQDCVLFS
jgi:hypothetical protein